MKMINDYDTKPNVIRMIITMITNIIKWYYSY